MIHDFDNHTYYKRKTPLVQEPTKENPWAYDWTIFSLFDIGFGFTHGALNTLPTGSLLSNCGANSRSQRTEILNAVDYLEQRDFNLFIESMASAIYYVNATSINCYEGALEIFATPGEDNYFYKLIF